MNDQITKDPANTSADEHLSSKMISSFRSSFGSSDRNRMARNAVVNMGARKAGLNRDSMTRNNMTFSEEIETGDITNQKKSGRCWAFAGLNLLRLECMERMNLDSFELSQSYIMFWDKLEKANYFLENVLETLDEPTDSRLFMWLMDNPLEDGGQWDMFVNLVEKYGVVPKEVYPESASSSSTKDMNRHIKSKLREFASDLRSRHDRGASITELRDRKEDMLETIYRILSIHNDEPPRSFEWSWRDEDDEYHDAGTLTPSEFYDEYIDVDLTDYVSLIHCPTHDKSFDTVYTVSYLGSVQEGRPVLYLNMNMNRIKEITIDLLEDDHPVWFGCDVGKQLARNNGVLDTETYQFDLLYDTEFQMDKGERVTYGHSRMTHAMLFTGVDLDERQPERWKVENSWGKKSGKQGFIVMDDSWFDEFLYQVVVPRQKLSDERLQLLDESPVELPPWDPMGALAQPFS
jgi:bleomycin hydrolase